MQFHGRSLPLAAGILLAAGLPLSAQTPLRIDVAAPPAASSRTYQMGTALAPDGQQLAVDEHGLRLNGAAWIPAMGEFHFSRYPADQWRDELLKMKAGGIQIVASYVFWIHHEEVEGQFDWSAQRSLRRFAELCHDVGLKFVVRCGPWCHGEVRNGGLPDWILRKGWRERSDDPPYLDKVRILFGEIAAQLDGLLWKDGGPVVGVQLENEFRGPAEHLLSLKRLAVEAGLDVPLYTRTGWPELTTPMPAGEILPLYGGYAEGFWDRETTPMPGHYWMAYLFSPLRADSAIATDQLGQRAAKDGPDAVRDPYLTCEIGGGMMASYHRRVLIDPADVESIVLTKLGSGSTLPGYYMYHGGVNPEGKLTTLHESQATGYWNDLPIKCYDFQAPLGQYGQIRPHYHRLRRLHLWLDDWGAKLAHMPAAMPELRPAGRDDVDRLRWVVRSDGRGGFLFVNNYQRLRSMPAKSGVQFQFRLPTGALTLPQRPIAVPADSRFIWPFQLELAPGLTLHYATAQWVSSIDDDDDATTIFFAETPGVAAEFAFEGSDFEADAGSLLVERDGNRVYVRDVPPARNVAMTLQVDGKALRIVLLDERDSLAIWKADWLGRPRVFLTHAGLIVDGDALQLTASDPGELTVGVLPCPDAGLLGLKESAVRDDGVFRRLAPDAPRLPPTPVSIEQVKSAGPLRTIPLGKIDRPVPEAPGDDDFAAAATWNINLPDDLDLASDPLLRIEYAGDVARLSLDGQLIMDDFYNGRPLEIGLRRYGPNILRGKLELAILPLESDAPIYLAESARPDFRDSKSVAEVQRVEIVPRFTLHVPPPAQHTSSSTRHYLFSYFVGNGEDGLHLAHSTDGYSWNAVGGGRSLLRPTAGRDKLMRDPSISRGPDGVFHLVWTVSWGERGIGYSRSRDLVQWTPQRFLPVMAHEPAARNCWAPDLFYDAATEQFIICWATTIPGRFPQTDGQTRRGPDDPGYDHRLYYVTTRDFQEFSNAQLFYDHGFNAIDATLAKSADRYVMFLKDETDRPFPPQKNIRVAFADRATGPFGPPGEPITANYWAEGPTVLEMDGKWLVYFDKYRDHRYGLVTSRDLVHWTDESAGLKMPRGMRHGTAFEVPADVAERLLERR